ncbi:hypothetical protein ES708_33489 [subsurface metagenome]
MAFKVFISHSTADLGLVQQLQYSLQTHGIEAYLADLYPKPGDILASKISNAIDNSNCVIAVLTQDGARSQWVHQEIGYAKRARKLVIPIVEEGVPSTGFIQGVEYIRFNRENPADAINKIVAYLKRLKADKESGEMLLAGALIALGLLALASRR